MAGRVPLKFTRRLPVFWSVVMLTAFHVYVFLFIFIVFAEDISHSILNFKYLRNPVLLFWPFPSPPRYLPKFCWVVCCFSDCHSPSDVLSFFDRTLLLVNYFLALYSALFGM